jgi:hypothetical protein
MPLATGGPSYSSIIIARRGVLETARSERREGS